MRSAITLALAMLCAACGGDAARTDALERRIAAAERQLAAQQDYARRLEETLRRHGIPFWGASTASVEQALARRVQELLAQATRIEEARATRNVPLGQEATAAFHAIIDELSTQPDQAMPLLLATAEQKGPQQQLALMEAFASVGKQKAVPILREVFASGARPPAMRFQAGKSLLELDPDAGIPLVAAALREADPPLPDLYFLVFMIGNSGHPQAVPVLCETLRISTDRSVRCHAATALGNFPEEAAAQSLEAAATGDEYPSVRINALRALPKVTTDRERIAAIAAQVLSRDEDEQVRAVARELQ